MIHQVFATLEEAGGTRHYEFARYLAQKGHRVTVVASDVNYYSQEKLLYSQKKDEKSGINILRARTYRKLHSGFFGRLLSYISFMIGSLQRSLKVKNIDIILGTSPPIFQAMVACLVALIRRKVFVLEVRDLWPDFLVEIGVIKNKILICFGRMVERYIYKKARVIIVNSPGYINHIKSKGIFDKKIRLIPNSVDSSMFEPNEKGISFREELGITDKFLVLYAGAVGKANDIETLLNAAAILRDQEKIVFVIVGGGNERERMIEIARQEKLENVLFIPPVPKAKIPEVIAASDACVAILKNVPMFKITYPNKVFDYMAGGRPIVLVIDGVIREVVESAGAGIFAQPGNGKSVADAIMRLYRNPELRKRMGSNGRNYVIQHFERKNQASEFERVLLAAIEQQA